MIRRANPDQPQAQRNVLGQTLAPCSRDPLTGFFRDGTCRTCPDDVGQHVVCVKLTPQFLAFTKARGNDLTTPHPEYGFPGLKPGDRWCVCAARWVEAYHADVAPPVILDATHQAVLQLVDLEVLQAYALD